jgi:hypothetical protein
MSQLEDRYRWQGTAQQSTAEPMHFKYNRIVNVIIEVRDAMLKQVNRKSPEHFSWIWMKNEGESKVGWEIGHRGTEEVTDTFHLLSDGRIVSVCGEPARNAQGISYIRLIGTHAITIRRLDRPYTDEELFTLRLYSSTSLLELARKMLATLPCKYGFSDDPRNILWWGATL